MALRRKDKATGNDMFPGFVETFEIGVGSLATVYRAREIDTGRLVALKLLNVRDASARAIESFERESVALGSLSSHPNIVTLFRTFRTADGRPVLVLELCSGAIADRLHGGVGLPVQDAVSIGIKIAGALETAHRGGILHRDVKPQNILVTEFGEPALADFGVAMLQSSTQTTAGLFDFTTLHAAPELLEGGGTSAATDVYELASSLYQLIAGQSAFRAYDGESPASVILRILRDPVRPLMGTGVPMQLSDLLIRAMSKDKDHRPPTASEFAGELANVEVSQGWPRTQFLIRGPASTASGWVPDIMRMPDVIAHDTAPAANRAPGPAPVAAAPPMPARAVPPGPAGPAGQPVPVAPPAGWQPAPQPSIPAAATPPPVGPPPVGPPPVGPPPVATTPFAATPVAATQPGIAGQQPPGPAMPPAQTGPIPPAGFPPPGEFPPPTGLPIGSFPPPSGPPVIPLPPAALPADAPSPVRGADRLPMPNAQAPADSVSPPVVQPPEPPQPEPPQPEPAVVVPEAVAPVWSEPVAHESAALQAHAEVAAHRPAPEALPKQVAPEPVAPEAVAPEPAAPEPAAVEPERPWRVPIDIDDDTALGFEMPRPAARPADPGPVVDWTPSVPAAAEPAPQVQAPSEAPPLEPEPAFEPEPMFEPVQTRHAPALATSWWSPVAPPGDDGQPAEQFPIPPSDSRAAAGGAPTAGAQGVPTWAVRSPNPQFVASAPQFVGDISIDPNYLRPRLTVRAGLSSLTVDEQHLTMRSMLHRERLPWSQVTSFEPHFPDGNTGPTAKGVLVALTPAGAIELPATRRQGGELRHVHALLDAYRVRAQQFANG
ncbi:serine/threonine-protein kinase [Jatrophihabitans cynanchi]|nr:serine/threonine-protein kinase [Jatrophihabitans sp. SB3-54]